jgi:hypothetical protein
MIQIVNVTPPEFRCEIEVSCPAVFQTGERTYYVVGKTISPQAEGLQGKVASHESVVEISESLLEVAVIDILRRRSIPVAPTAQAKEWAAS